MYILQEDRAMVAKDCPVSMMGLITKITHDPADAMSFETREEAEKLLPKLNLSPMAKWKVVEV